MQLELASGECVNHIYAWFAHGISEDVDLAYFTIYIHWKIKYSYNFVNVNWTAKGKNEEAGPKQEWRSAVDVFGGESEVG